MATSETRRGLKAFLFVCAIVLAISAAFVHQAPPQVSSISARHALSNFARSSLPKVAVPFGIKDGLLLSAVQPVEQNLTKSRNGFQKQAVGKALSKRAISWDIALAAGKESLARLDSPRVESVVTTLDQVKAGGWSITDETDTITQEYNEPKGPFQDLKISRADCITRSARQNQVFNNCHRNDNPATNARFQNIYNVPGRTIIGDQNFGCIYTMSRAEARMPRPAVPRDPIETRIPDIWAWSDIVWNMWADEAGDAASTLKYIFKHHIITPDTRLIMDLAADVDDDELDADWEVHADFTFYRGEEEYQALLGTPHGKGIVHMLTGHPNALRDRSLESITLFTSGDSDNPYYNLLFTLSG